MDVDRDQVLQEKIEKLEQKKAEYPWCSDRYEEEIQEWKKTLCRIGG